MKIYQTLSQQPLPGTRRSHWINSLQKSCFFSLFALYYQTQPRIRSNPTGPSCAEQRAPTPPAPRCPARSAWNQPGSWDHQGNTRMELQGCCGCCHHKMTIHPTAAPRQERTSPGQTNPALSGHEGAWHRAVPARRGCWHSQEHGQGLSWSRTLQHGYFWLIKGATSSCFHSLVKTPAKLTREMIWKLLFSAGL